VQCAVGLAQELMDALPGGSGFSLSDLTADAAGNRFGRAATRDAGAARAMQARLEARARFANFFPDVRDLPERRRPRRSRSASPASEAPARRPSSPSSNATSRRAPGYVDPAVAVKAGAGATQISV